VPFAFTSLICNTAKVFTMLAEKCMYAAQQSSSALVSDDSDAENEHSITFNLPSSLVHQHFNMCLGISLIPLNQLNCIETPFPIQLS
jgi:hypothetical protein